MATTPRKRSWANYENSFDVLSVSSLDVITVLAEIANRDPQSTVVEYYYVVSFVQQYTTCMTCMFKNMPAYMFAHPVQTWEDLVTLVERGVLHVVSFTDMPADYQCPRCRASLVTRNPQWKKEFGLL